MDIFFLLVGSITGGLFVYAGANVGLAIICGLTFVAAALVRLAQAVERVREVQGATAPDRHAWPTPDAPVKEGGTGAV